MRFVDTSFWIALQFRRDAHFAEATQLWQDNSEALITTNLVVGETRTFLRRRLGHPQARAFVESARVSTRLSIVTVDETTEFEAWEWLLRHDERVYSFVDATSFTFMRRHGLTEALAFDGDFSAAGFLDLLNFERDLREAALSSVVSSRWPISVKRELFTTHCTRK